MSVVNAHYVFLKSRVNAIQVQLHIVIMLVVSSITVLRVDGTALHTIQLPGSPDLDAIKVNRSTCQPGSNGTVLIGVYRVKLYVHVCVQACMHVCMSACKHTKFNMHACMYECSQVCAHTCKCEQYMTILFQICCNLPKPI